MGRLRRKKGPIKTKKKYLNNLKKSISTVNDTSSTLSNGLLTHKDKKKDFLSGKSLINHKSVFFMRAILFLKESKKELKKVVWPSKKQAISSTLVVVIVVAMVSFFLGVIDIGLSGAIRIVLHH